jgi:hypothetical protein
MGKLIILLFLFLFGCAPQDTREVHLPVVFVKQAAGLEVLPDDYKINDIVIKSDTIWYSKDFYIKLVKNENGFILEISNNLNPEVAASVKLDRLQAVEDLIIAASDTIKIKRGENDKTSIQQ